MPRRSPPAWPSTVTASSPAAPTTISCWSIFDPKDINGKQAQEILDRAGITVNKNGIPFDTYPIFKPGGIRIGTPAVTTRGMKEEEMLEIADLINDALNRRDDAVALEQIRAKVRELTSRFPLPA